LQPYELDNRENCHKGGTPGNPVVGSTSWKKRSNRHSSNAVIFRSWLLQPHHFCSLWGDCLSASGHGPKRS